MALGFRKFISEVFVNGKFPKILPFENFPLYGRETMNSYRIMANCIQASVFLPEIQLQIFETSAA